MRPLSPLRTAVLAFAIVVSARCLFAQQLTVRQIMAEPSIAGMRVEGEKLSPDGRYVAYTWNAAGVEPRDLYLVSTATVETRVLAHAGELGADTAPASERRNTADPLQTKNDAMQRAREQSIGSIDWSSDSRRILFTAGGDIYVTGIDASSKPRRITRTTTPEVNPRWLPDGHRILYQSAGNLFTIDVDQAALVQLTKEGGGPTGARAENQNAAVQSGQSNSAIQAVRVSNDGLRVAFVVVDTSKQRGLIVPNFAGDYVTTQTTRRGWTEQHIYIINTDGTSNAATAVRLPNPEGVSYIRTFEWMTGDTGLVIDRIDQNTKRRQLFRAEASKNGGKDAQVQLIDQETDEKWAASLSRIFDVSPGGLFFTSERDGFNQIYRQDPAVNADSIETAQASKAVELTHGHWEVSWAKWLPDGKHIIYLSTEGSTAERTFHVLEVATGRTELLDTPKGLNTDPQISRDGQTLMFEHSEWNVPAEVYVVNVCAGCKVQTSIRVTKTIPAEFNQIHWVQPQFFEYAAKDGKRIKARVYVPDAFDKTKSWPAVVFVHGAGYLQNVVNGWNNYYREAMFNSLLAQHGYVVLDIDYRGSSGYGREWRTDVYDFLGGLDLQDHLDGIDYIVRNYGVDPKRVGMYGGSYGGFMAEMAVLRAPEHIACAAALRPVSDWKNYYASSPVYTAERLGFPEKNVKGYDQSSPITYAGDLSRPLLILHGMVDDNVHFQDTVRMVERLIELGKTDYFDVMFYPKENHGFTRADSWTDEYERILKFFDAHLRRAG